MLSFWFNLQRSKLQTNKTIGVFVNKETRLQNFEGDSGYHLKYKRYTANLHVKGPILSGGTDTKFSLVIKANKKIVYCKTINLTSFLSITNIVMF